ncbi:hypothetical protein SEA_VORVOLAKOS_83 [Streptomyces phage Vorvolakos]|uniref:Uncharacterized protein n=3 Tax=Flowerpowervirus flowerpower TaxID=2846396 RepID=A0A2U8UNH2_9CAUD|nr:hypothetical protein HWB61_gp19 [Streptomyces phage FlowerPower]QEA11284.1 hypothetical protein SEA_GEOSTIN_77 [Streptomyces phage Geostin]QFP94782.1 hypothetical protein SEA_FABIAN_81 [Streptomyces phage Fabian]QZD97128.1 hypothetical protein SEA_RETRIEVERFEVER_82 [Streptomyces phage RetrieverFever]UOW93293.1 hypothetical protein SEA_VORVOLAKOS_83 [Streptomyces phage Vorvolakos]AWN05163.1 hypothetical protein SEA_FLOWERPOWER_82 [Streptomyces phage FlowerPower]
MTLNATSSSEYYSVGDKVVKTSYGDTYGVHVLKKVYVEEANDYLYLVQEGDVKAGKWVGLKYENGPVIKALTIKQLRNGYTHKWTPGIDVKPGDILVDQDNVLFLVASTDVVWNLSKGTKTTLAKWEASGTDYGNRKFTRKTTASGHNFSSVVELKDLWSNRF